MGAGPFLSRRKSITSKKKKKKKKKKIGMMWNKDDKLQDCKAVIPDRCYATMYKEIIDYCRENGAFDASTMGHVSNVGLMAQKAEEYGSHDKTFEIPASGTMRVTDASGNKIFEHQ